MKTVFFSVLFLFFLQVSVGQVRSTEKIDNVMPVRGLAIEAPRVQGVDQFCKFIEEELAPAHFNMLVLRVDWNYAYECHPELRDNNPLTKADIRKIADVCKRHKIKIAPQINLLGHQSWASTTHNLLRVYPEFDEAPHIKTEDYENYPTGNAATYPDGLYCKSYCPLHPDVHKIVFALVDELMDAFEAEWFHAGLDEVFHLGEDRCPRCGGKDKAELFAGEVNKIRDHLALKNRRLMMWADRLIDGKTTGLGPWEASFNNTHRAIDMIHKDVFMCDWHYERADLTSVYFAMKGFDVVTCPWRYPDIAAVQLQNMVDFRKQSTQAMGERFKGIIHTVWSGADQFLRLYYNPETYNLPADATLEQQQRGGDARTLKRVMEEFKILNN